MNSVEKLAVQRAGPIIWKEALIRGSVLWNSLPVERRQTQSLGVSPLNLVVVVSSDTQMYVHTDCTAFMECTVLASY